MGRDVPKPFNWKEISPPFHRLCADLNSRTRGSQPTRPLFQTDISGSGGNPSQPSEPPGKLSGPAGRGSVTQSSRKCLCNSGEVQPGIQPVSLSFSRFSPTQPPGPGADSKKPDTKKAIYLASHFLDSLSNYFSYLYLNERFLWPCPVSFCFVRQGSLGSIFPPDSWTFLGMEAGGTWGQSRESSLEKAKAAGPENF